MQRFRTFHYTLAGSVVIATGLALSCATPDETVPPGTGGSGAAAGAGSPGTGGSSSGSPSGGVGPATGGTAPGTGGSNAGTPGTGGSATGGSATGGMGGGASGMSGAGGRGGGGGAGPQGGAGGASAGSGSGGSAGSMPSSGCGKAAPASMRYSMDVGGTMREYILAVPSGYDPMRAYRLIFAWHPLGGSAQSTAGNGSSGYYGMQGASQGSAILVSPEGTEGGMGRGWWNQGGADIAFFRALLDRLKGEMCIDEKRIFSTGFSFGGMFSYSVGCTGLVRAIAPMAGNPQVSGCIDGTQPVAMMGFHGVNDSVVAISGGRQGRDIFIERNGCMEQTMPTMPSWCDGVNASNEPCTCVSYQGCTAGYPVTWCEFNADHTPAPNSATTIWNFFSQF